MEATGHEHIQRRPRANMFASWNTEALAGAGGAVLAIIGLSHVEPTYMVAVAGIALGAALLIEGGVVTAEYATILRRAGGESIQGAGFGGGLSAQAMVGAAAIILSLLALLGLPNPVLMGVVSILLGAGLILSSGVNARLEAMKVEAAEVMDSAKDAAADEIATTAGADGLAGMAGIVLGLLALVGIVPTVLNLTAMLVIGTAVLMSGSAATVGLIGMFAPSRRS